MLEGKVAFITGGASGIGAACAVLFAAKGAKVVIADIADPEATLIQIHAASGEANAVNLNVTDEAAVDAAVDSVKAQWGRLDIGVNCAGISLSRPGEAWGALDLYDREVSINQRGVLLCMRAQLRHMVAQASGAIINMSSVCGQTGIADAGYTASKHAVIGFTRSAALAHARMGIRVNCICPGVIQTPMSDAMNPGSEARKFMESMLPMNRLGMPEEIANGALFLASDMASFVTGHALVIDGGFLAG